MRSFTTTKYKLFLVLFCQFWAGNLAHRTVELCYIVVHAPHRQQMQYTVVRHCHWAWLQTYLLHRPGCHQNRTEPDPPSPYCKIHQFNCHVLSCQNLAAVCLLESHRLQWQGRSCHNIALGSVYSHPACTRQASAAIAGSQSCTHFKHRGSLGPVRKRGNATLYHPRTTTSGYNQGGKFLLQQ